MMVTLGSLTPREVWAMPLTEALGLCLGKAALGKQGASRKADGKPYEDGPGGTRVYKIDSMAKLQGFLGRGHV